MRRAMAWVLVAFLALAAGCGGSGSDDSKQQDAAAAARARAEAAVHARRMDVGRRVFARYCVSCHTLAGKHYTTIPPFEWEAPDLDEVRLKRSYVRERVEIGGPSMGSFSQLSRAKMASVIEYVTETAGGNAVDEGDQPASELAAGREVFAQHCAACHAIEGRAPTGHPLVPAIDFTLVKPSERYVMRRVRGGLPEDGGVMPSFSRRALSDAQLRAVATYVTAVAKEGTEAPQPR